MKKILFSLILFCMIKTLHAQTPYIYTIKADSVKITNTCDTAELIIENHTQNVPGFLFNKGRGRTEFRRVLQRINDNIYLVGSDSLKFPNAWVQGGNAFGTTGILGTNDNNHLDFYTNGIKRGRLDNIGRFSLDYPAGISVDAFSLTTNNGTKKWFNIYSDINNTIMSFNRNTSYAGDLESMRITASGSGGSIFETFAYSDLSIKGFNGLDLYGGYGAGSSKYIRFFPAGNLAATFTYNGNFLLGNTTDNGNKLQVNGNISLTNSSNSYLGSTRFPILIGNDAGGGGIAFLFDGDPTARLIRVGCAHSNNFHKFQFQSAGQGGDSSACYNFTYNSNTAHALNIFNFADGNTKLMLTAPGNLLVNTTTDNGSKLQVNGSSYFNGTHFVTGSASVPNGGAHTYFTPTVTSTGGDWDYLNGVVIAPTLNFSSNNQNGAGVLISPTFNLNGTSQYPDAVSSALQVNSLLGGIKIVQPAAAPAGTSGQPLFIEQNGTANKELIHNYRNHNSCTLPFIWNHDTRAVENRSAMVPAIRSTISLPEAGAGISYTMDRYYYGTEAAMEMKYETTPAGDTAPTRNTSIAFKTMSAGTGYTTLYLYGNNAGLGTTTPSAQLHTTGSVRFAGLTSDNSQARIVVSDAYGNLYYRDASSLVMNETINSDLAVNGRVSAQKMLITQTGRWPDYVFSKQYQLPSLTEVENFIKLNNHLPGMPAAAEVENKGIDVGNNQAALLKKVEELTLYAIEQDKKLKKQEQEISVLKDQNKELELLKQQMAELKALIKKQ